LEAWLGVISAQFTFVFSFLRRGATGHALALFVDGESEGRLTNIGLPFEFAYGNPRVIDGINIKPKLLKAVHLPSRLAGLPSK
jgi:hypothetical protein